MLRTVGEAAAADIREHNPTATARRHSAVGGATLTALVVDGVRARRVHVAGGVAAVAADGEVEVVVVVLAAGGSGRAFSRPGTQESHPSEDQNVLFSP